MRLRKVAGVVSERTQDWRDLNLRLRGNFDLYRGGLTRGVCITKPIVIKGVPQIAWRSLPFLRDRFLDKLLVNLYYEKHQRRGEQSVLCHQQLVDIWLPRPNRFLFGFFPPLELRSRLEAPNYKLMI